MPITFAVAGGSGRRIEWVALGAGVLRMNETPASLFLALGSSLRMQGQPGRK